LESLVDGWNRRVDAKTLKSAYPSSDVREQPSPQTEVAAWFVGRLKN
jgi:hypothetical protein